MNKLKRNQFISQWARVTYPGRRLRPECPARVICLDGSFFDVVV